MGLKTEGEKRCFQGGLFSRVLYVALHTADPDAANELTESGYARIPVNAAGWQVDTATGEASNVDDIAFPERTVDWSDPTHVGLWDQAAAGNLLASLALDSDVSAPAPHVEVSFPAGTLAVNLETDV